MGHDLWDLKTADDLTDFPSGKPIANWKDPPSLKTANPLRISMAIFSS